MSSRRSITALLLSNTFGGIGVASGIAVGALLVASMGGDHLAGTGQAVSIFGAAVLAVPLANLAARRGRRLALALGYVIAAAGAVVVLIGAWLGSLLLVLAGLVAFGAAQATNLQSRYAAADLASPDRRATLMSIVLWATTIGSVVGPNLSGAGAALGSGVRLPELAGPYLFSVAGFALAGVAIVALYRSNPLSAAPVVTVTEAVSAPKTGAVAALRWAATHPVARFAVLLIVVGHAVMVGVMSMTPVHLGHEGHGLSAIGLVISLHIMGMYALSPVVGWLADRFGAMRTAVVGLLLLASTAGIILVAPKSFPLVTVALVLLGVGWSFTMISGSALLARTNSGDMRVPLQGATDALMNYAGAAAALIGGPILAWLGYGGLALVAAVLILPAGGMGWVARRSRTRVAPSAAAAKH
ncbi:MFS transporter [Tessaracoccus sp. MC1756]|uniref:MFS transporter n=1 Tax=Tessaracoccus sp. MC1756 TaxID=2760311 RepID=UPI0016017A0D|nr:MFS transporter [Tessaracoccus sp. MC1756]MBB1508513.1 MFS transporter [Tessaracoccus sp. MC1756]